MSELSIGEGQSVDLDHESVGVIITCPKLGAFMFQQNGNEHPDPRCRGKYQLWGGRMEPQDNGDPYVALNRELHEEWRDQGVADEVMATIDRRVLPTSFTPWSNGGTKRPYRYRLHTYLAIANQHQYMDWFTRLTVHGFNEGHLTVMDRQCVELHIEDFDKRKLFLGGLSDVLKYYFDVNEILRY